MAKIKEIPLKIDNIEYSIKINCSKNGIFSCKIPYEICASLGIPFELSSQNLKDLEDKINSSYSAYIESNRTRNLVVAIYFKANGEFVQDKDGNINKAFRREDGYVGGKFFHNSFRLFSSCSSSELIFGYKVFIEEVINSNRQYYDALPEEKTLSVIKDNRLKIGNYYKGLLSSDPQREALILPYSDNLLKNLERIKNQLRNATMFLAGLLSQKEEAEKLLTGSLNLLGNE